MATNNEDKYGRRDMEDLTEQHEYQIDNASVKATQFHVTSASEAAQMNHPGHGQHENSKLAKASLKRGENKSPLGEPVEERHNVNSASAPHTKFERVEPAATTPPMERGKGEKESSRSMEQPDKGKSLRGRK